MSEVKTIHICGKRGMGDLVQGIGDCIYRIDSDTHIIFHYPAGTAYDYDELLPAILDSYQLPNYNITYEIDSSWYSVHHNVCKKTYGNQNYVFSGNLEECRSKPYPPFKKQWEGNGDYICVTLNHEYYNEHHPLLHKFFDDEINTKLINLVDNTSIYSLGPGRTFQERVDLIANAKYVIGIEGGWTHVTNAMRAPFIVVRNKTPLRSILRVHGCHPSLDVINIEHLDHYIKPFVK